LGYCLNTALVIKELSTPLDLLKLVVAQSYHALIDAGAFLRDKTSNEVAKLIFQLYLLQSDSAVRKKVVFISSDDVVRLYTESEDGQAHETVYQNEWQDSDDLFIYYDQRHVVGIDIKQPYRMKGLTTVNYFNTHTEISQAIFRLRNLNNGHSMDYYCFTLGVQGNVNEHNDDDDDGDAMIDVDEHVEFSKDIKTITQLYSFLLDNERSLMNNMQTQINTQNIKVLRRFDRCLPASFIDYVYNDAIDDLPDFKDIQSIAKHATHERLCKFMNSLPHTIAS
jgi:hypothetical protein